MTKKHIISAVCLLATLNLSSCVWQIVTQTLVRDEYPGERPTRVITDPDAANKQKLWRTADPNALPPAGNIAKKQPQLNSDGIPYGYNSDFSNIIISPYNPHYQLDYAGIPVGSKVWDPYTRQPFYIPRAYKFN